MTQKPKILIGPSSYGNVDPAPITLLREAGYEVVANDLKRRYTREELLDRLPGIVGLIAGLEPLDRPILETSELKALARVGSGMVNVDQSAAGELGIKVSNTPDGPTLAVAELTVGCLMNLLRETSAMDRSMRAGKWDKRTGRQLRDLTVTIVGFGRIGRKTGELLGALGVTIIAVDPMYREDVAGVAGMSLHDALSQSDAVSLHASGEEAILDAHAFASMKDGMYVLNPGRGGLVDYKCLFDALDSGKIAGVWADAHPEEPYKGALLNYDQALLTPHIGSYAREGRVKMEVDAAQNLIDDLKAAGI
ncbi:MAG: NAD(P)-dependent oxidoreductase [Maricaulis sp.]|uniref:NAD(P)-dependent oxidoreductase n=1 Tax=Maricaulis sp. TaxID=1486257 RepID=UPI002612A40E|nr:NAD(P)-dependent oxidoreductase [Maricaulis sp.]MDM7984933.1 NAD(P)-dependent oxidoreductase [Maricaulis sp.]